MKTLPLILLLMAWALPAQAQWPTSIRENLPVAVSAYAEDYPVTVLLNDGSLLVAYFSNSETPSRYFYQIVETNGQLRFNPPEYLTPALNDPDIYGLEIIPDSTGGAITAWFESNSGPHPGYYAQKLDVAGNRVWGDAGLFVGTFLPNCNYLGLCPDGQGGFFMAAHGDPDGMAPMVDQVHAYRVSATGQLLWGGLTGIPVCPFPATQKKAKVCPDGQGGIFVVWQDNRNGPYGKLFGQRLDSAGIPQWDPLGVELYSYSPWLYETVPDGAGGFLVHCGSGTFNRVIRYAPTGDSLWVRDYVSWYPTARMISGEPGYAYLCFGYQGGMYAQRLDMEGNCHWPTWGSGQPGALVMPFGQLAGCAMAYRWPFLYMFVSVQKAGPATLPVYSYGQKLDSLGRRQWGNQGTLMYVSRAGENPQDLSSVGDGGGGMVTTFMLVQNVNPNVWAKRVAWNGQLGGAMPEDSPRTVPTVTARLQGEVASYRLAVPSQVRVSLFDLLGRKVAVLEDGWKEAGEYTVTLPRLSLSSGVYLVRMQAGEFTQVQKLVLLK
ncbi:MAG: T9SS C-terminal target domain-containing protein [Candidatus Zixiibacteriota bacterium]|nr:MAG: T9SS C-terminal target domain-containing protein [candidate division Zixibacteria bacterium]